MSSCRSSISARSDTISNCLQVFLAGDAECYAERWAAPLFKWKELAVKEWNPAKHRLQNMTHTELRRQFIRYAESRLKHWNLPHKRIRAWVNIMPPTDREGWEETYPHAHDDGGSMSVILYLQADKDHPPLDIFDGDELVHTIRPEPGMAVYMPDGVMHGVRENNGKRARIALVARGYGD